MHFHAFLAIAMRSLFFTLALLWTVKASEKNVPKEKKRGLISHVELSNKVLPRETLAQLTISLLPSDLNAQIFANLTTMEVLSLRAVCQLWKSHVDSMVVSFPVAPSCPFSFTDMPNLKQLTAHSVEFDNIAKVTVLQQVIKLKLVDPKDMVLPAEFDPKVFENLNTIEIYNLQGDMNLSLLAHLPKLRTLKFVACTMTQSTMESIPCLPDLTHFSWLQGENDTSQDALNITTVAKKFTGLIFFDTIVWNTTLGECLPIVLPNLKEFCLFSFQESESNMSPYNCQLTSERFSRFPNNLEHLTVVNFRQVDFSGMANLLNTSHCNLKSLTITTNLPNWVPKVYDLTNFFYAMDPAKEFTLLCHPNVIFYKNGEKIARPEKVQLLKENQ